MPNRMSVIMVVDDEEVIRFTLQKKLSRLGYRVISLEKAEDALYLLKNGEETVDLVIADVKLRKMDGIELLSRIRGLNNPVPVLIITAHGNVDDAVKALRYGASDFIRKPFDINDLASSVRSIIRQKEELTFAENFARYARYEKSIFHIPVDSNILNAITYRLTRDLSPAGICNQPTAENIALALREAINNAMFHGNLEVSSKIRENEGLKAFNEEIEIRKKQEKYKNREVIITYEMTPEYVEYHVEDQGPGFDYSSLPDPRDPENFFRNSGRGLLIISIHMDEISWNEQGNIIRMRKYRVERNENAKGEENETNRMEG